MLNAIRKGVAVLIWLVALAGIGDGDLIGVLIIAAVGAAIWPWRKRKELEP